MTVVINGTSGITQSGTSKANAYLDVLGGNTATVNGITIALASQAQAEAGTDNATLMTPLRSSQAITALAPSNATTRFGDTVVTAKSRSSGTVYQNTTGGWLFVAFAAYNNGTAAYVGATASPSTLVNSSNATNTGGSFMVPPAWYYYLSYSAFIFCSEGQA